MQSEVNGGAYPQALKSSRLWIDLFGTYIVASQAGNA
jgi:hypothetical protein